MGFIIKSAFWLGIVYSAMPLGQDPAMDPASDAGAFLCGPASAAVAAGLPEQEAGSFRLGVAAGCAAVMRARLEGAPPVKYKPNPEAAAAPAKVSAETLTDLDREPPWIGRERRTALDEPNRGWRAARASSYKRLANSHPEHPTVDD